MVDHQNGAAVVGILPSWVVVVVVCVCVGVCLFLVQH